LLTSVFPLADAVIVNRPMSVLIALVALPCWSKKTVTLPVPFSTCVTGKPQRSSVQVKLSTLKADGGRLHGTRRRRQRQCDRGDADDGAQRGE